jgi:hypothetical protein
MNVLEDYGLLKTQDTYHVATEALFTLYKIKVTSMKMFFIVVFNLPTF